MKDAEVARFLSLILRHEPKRIGLRIRAAQGHSLPIDLGLTARDNLDAIFREGLKPGRRQMVHLSADRETA